MDALPAKKKSNIILLSFYDSLRRYTWSHIFICVSNISVLEPDCSLRFYWLDYLEHEGKLYFMGRLVDKGSDASAFCCVAV
jgi:hypothetical protein